MEKPTGVEGSSVPCGLLEDGKESFVNMGRRLKNKETSDGVKPLEESS